MVHHCKTTATVIIVTNHNWQSSQQNGIWIFPENKLCTNVPLLLGCWLSSWGFIVLEGNCSCLFCGSWPRSAFYSTWLFSDYLVSVKNMHSSFLLQYDLKDLALIWNLSVLFFILINSIMGLKLLNESPVVISNSKF